VDLSTHIMCYAGLYDLYIQNVLMNYLSEVLISHSQMNGITNMATREGMSTSISQGCNDPGSPTLRSHSHHELMWRSVSIYVRLYREPVTVPCWLSPVCV